MQTCCSVCRMLRASIVGLLALLSAASAQDFQCTSQGNFRGNALTVSAASGMSVEEWAENPCQDNHVVRPRAISCAEMWVTRADTTSLLACFSGASALLLKCSYHIVPAAASMQAFLSSFCSLSER
eukprot:1272207-Pleurochrysis_carterae.AAC.2